MKISLKTGCETPKTVLAECTLKKKKNGRLKMLAAFLYLIYSGGKKNS